LKSSTVSPNAADLDIHPGEADPLAGVPGFRATAVGRKDATESRIGGGKLGVDMKVWLVFRLEVGVHGFAGIAGVFAVGLVFLSGAVGFDIGGTAE